MKATVNGITVEGTPDEIATLLQIMQERDDMANGIARTPMQVEEELQRELDKILHPDPWTLQGDYQNQEHNLKMYHEYMERNKKNLSILGSTDMTITAGELDAQKIMGMGEVIGDTNTNYGMAQGRKPSPVDVLHGHDIQFLQKIATELKQEGGGEAWGIGKMVELVIEECGQNGKIQNGQLIIK